MKHVSAAAAIYVPPGEDYGTWDSLPEHYRRMAVIGDADCTVSGRTIRLVYQNRSHYVPMGISGADMDEPDSPASVNSPSIASEQSDGEANEGGDAAPPTPDRGGAGTKQHRPGGARARVQPSFPHAQTHTT